VARIFDRDKPARTGARDEDAIARLDTASRRALAGFWASVALAAAAAALMVWYSQLRAAAWGLSLAVFGIGALAVVALLVMSRSMRRLHLESREEAEADRHVGDYLEQLDDRFAVFTDVRIDDIWIDHIILGPSGVFAVTTAVRLDKSGHPPQRDVTEAEAGAVAVGGLLKRLVPRTDPVVEPVLCLAAGHLPAVERVGRGVWVVPGERMVPALLKRSGQPGSITSGVRDTGAFNMAAIDSAAFEEELARHLRAAVRPTLRHYAPGPEFTKDR
jgi:hypothetical protein